MNIPCNAGCKDPAKCMNDGCAQAGIPIVEKIREEEERIRGLNRRAAACLGKCPACGDTTGLVESVKFVRNRHYAWNGRVLEEQVVEAVQRQPVLKCAACGQCYIWKRDGD